MAKLRRLNPYLGDADTPGKSTDHPALGWRIVFRADRSKSTGIGLATPDAVTPFLTLSPDERVQMYKQFTRDGRFLIWGLEDGTVLVCEMDRVCELLKTVGMGWDK